MKYEKRDTALNRKIVALLEIGNLWHHENCGLLGTTRTHMDHVEYELFGISRRRTGRTHVDRPGDDARCGVTQPRLPDFRF